MLSISQTHRRIFQSCWEAKPRPEMLRWLGPRKATMPNDGRADPIPSVLQDDDVTDDPLATLDAHRRGQQIYSVTRMNPLFRDTPAKPAAAPMEKSSSSGYGSSFYGDVATILEQNPTFVKSIKLPTRAAPNRSLPSSGSSGAGTLTTIPEGRVDPVPEPVWPADALLEPPPEVSVREVLLELLQDINAATDGGGLTPEEALKAVNERIVASIQSLRSSTEDEMRRLCVNLSNCRRINSVLRAFGDGEEGCRSPGGSSSGCSDANAPPMFVHEDLASVPNGMRNALIYGTMYRGRGGRVKEEPQKKVSLRDVNDNKPSVWEQYYGVRAVQEGQARCVPKPTDVPLFPGGRPEADFTLDVPRSELLSKQMKQDKKWRCRCRLLTSFLGLIFFLLSVMAVSLMLTRGKRMFGSMM